ncbi:beta-N-acetylglucosaminidase domain-containing protein [Streptomyces sp. RS10V-4]|uniref:beta-N-acetylglucosaminidase domain-containing protein n=1 Tax=Streptomyces rhizoryzae TaxID=2932493 RepID=UPI0020056500|nr:beta-N-acetylglucosaminidase domain-containing protein [Streptomyces rhizoryzae]MCK7626801.1 beta-N-acetylglucosaminidase domain-containing protein [Streptomyces rhizoryzae]
MAGTTALAAAVIGGLLGGAPAASGAPAAPAAGTPDGPGRPADAGPPPAVWPRPQSLRQLGPPVRLGPAALLVAPPDADPYALDVLRGLLRDAGVRTVRQTAPGGRLPADGPVLLAGGAPADEALRALRVPPRGDLPSGGYRLAVGQVSGRDTVALDGTGPDGLFHAAQTLRQLVAGGPDGTRQLASVAVRDWPATAVRGTAEGFYGQPWSPAQRLAQLDFMGRTKQNQYLYAPGDDPYRQARWRDPYPAARRAEFRALAERARANHVTPAWAVAPGQTMCLSSQDDLRALRRKVDAMWALGMRAFQLQFQDVSYSEWHCAADEETFGSGPQAAAKAQAGVANALARHLAERHPGAAPLTLMPTEFYQDGATAYRTALAAALDDRVEVAWTGVGVVPRTITGGELSAAREAFGHPLVTMDNYPVNDYAQDRIFLGPATGREPAVATGSAAVLANAMEQPLASRIPLFTAADYAWNPRDYHPAQSWEAALDDLAGGDPTARTALRTLAGNTASSVLGQEESGYLQPLIDRFWAARAAAVDRGRPGDDPGFARAAAALRAAFCTMSAAPRGLPSDLRAEVGPWAEQLARYGTAGQRAVDTLLAQARDDGDAAWAAQREVLRLRAEAKRSPATVGKGVLAPFLDRAMTEADAWTGARGGAPAPSPGDGRASLTVPFPRVRPLTAVTALTEPGPDAGAASLEAHVPGAGWQRLTALSATGWTEAGTGGLRADAVRVAWDAGGRAPSVRALTPWFGDTPRAGLELSRTEADARTGGRTAVQARISALRPGPVRDRLEITAPEGFTVRAPGELAVPRGGTAVVPLTVEVPEDARSGTYRIAVAFAGQRRELAVRVFPPTGGPDLARGAEAVSSGDETGDFPASAATDGDGSTRWSSPADDHAWLRFTLPRPTRLGLVVLHWQDAYAAAYRVQVSSDGRTWRTAATVRDGRGGREAVRTDAPDTRYVRIQGDRRATDFGYSLWGVEAYAVTEEPWGGAGRAAGAPSPHRRAAAGRGSTPRGPGRPPTQKPGTMPIRHRSGPTRRPRRTAASRAASAGPYAPCR